MPLPTTLLRERATTLAAFLIRHKRRLDGDAYATKAELQALLADPLAGLPCRHVEALLDLAAEDLQAAVPRWAAWQVRAFIRGFQVIVARDEADPYIRWAGTTTYRDDTRAQRLASRLSLPLPVIATWLSCWLEVEEHHTQTPACRYRRLLAHLGVPC